MQKTTPTKPNFGKATFVEIVPNASRTLAAMRELGYKSTDAILDIVDNSLDAHATRIDIDVREGFIAIADNGSGMDQPTLQEALRLGSEREYNVEDLGRFGVGLVTAAISIGRNLRVLTRKEGHPAYDAALDLDVIDHQNKFIAELHPAKSADAIKRLPDHGTLVGLSKIDRISDSNPRRFREKLAASVGRVYRRYYDKGVKFYINGRKVDRLDPLMLDHELTEVVKETDITFAPGKVAHLRIVELPDLGAGDEDAGITGRASGFYLIRNNREIAAAETFGLSGLESRHHSYSHFRAELSFTRELDEFFHVNVKKNFVQFDDRMIAKVAHVAEPFIRASGAKSRESGIRLAAIPLKSHDAAVQLLTGPPSNNGHASREPSKPLVEFREEDLGPKHRVFVNREEDGRQIIVYNRQHPFLKFVAEEARQRPALVLDLLVHALIQAEAAVPNGAKFVEAVEAALSAAVKKSA